MKNRFFVTALLVVLPGSFWMNDCVAVQGNAKELDESKEASSVVEKSKEIQPEKVPKLFGFGGGLQISGTSASSNRMKTSIQERDSRGVLVRTAEIFRGGGELSVKVTRSFGVDQREELLEALPQLTEDTGGFPRQVDEFDIELTVGITRTFTAKDTDEFEKKYPDIYRCYQRQFRRGRGDGFAVDGDVFRRRIIRPEVRGAPMPGARIGGIDDRLGALQERMQGELETAKIQVGLLESALAMNREKFGTEHKSTVDAEQAVANARENVARIEKSIASIKKTSELRKLDQIELERVQPERKQSDDK